MATAASAFDVAFESFRFDPIGLRLWRDAQEVPLQAKPAAVLAYLVGHSGRLVSKQELLAAVWPGAVSPAVLMVAIRAVRVALDDTAAAPRFVQTLDRAGYRFLAVPQIRHTPSVAATPVIGRDEAFDRLRRRFAAARSGRRQLVLVTGEAGIGKTAVVDRFAASIAAQGDVAVGRGQCMEIYGESEAYMPILEALEDLCRGPRGSQAVAALRQAAPTWVTQLPAWIAGDELEVMRKRAATATLERIQNEILSALELLASGGLVVLVIEDLHVSDPSTVDLLRFFLDRGSGGQLMIIGTSRPAGLGAAEDPLGSLNLRGASEKDVEQIGLELLQPSDVAAYLRSRLATDGISEELAGALHRYTEGNPLFLVSMVGYLLDRDLLRLRNGEWILERPVDGAGIPENLRLVIRTVVARAGGEIERLLRVAAVQGLTFDSAVQPGAHCGPRAIGASGRQLRRVEQYTHLVRLQGSVDLSGGQRANRYRFAHVLCQNALYDSLEAKDRIRLSIWASWSSGTATSNAVSPPGSRSAMPNTSRSTGSIRACTCSPIPSVRSGFSVIRSRRDGGWTKPCRPRAAAAIRVRSPSPSILKSSIDSSAAKPSSRCSARASAMPCVPSTASRKRRPGPHPTSAT
ncbi:MAG TPA: AAA family ATPase [Terriglobales bacterium]|nr:AAA family ATPase [Terriglobales bacterium]